MIISHKYKYLFVQIPRTASTSMGRELLEHYGGEKILWKHARYSDFLKQASDTEKTYFTFAGQRNPLDALVTKYFRAKYRKLQKLEKEKQNPNSRKKHPSENQIRKWRYIVENDLTFDQFFNHYHSHKIDRFYRRIERGQMDFVYRFETLQQDFSRILKCIGTRQKRDLPQHSRKTVNKKCGFYQYYSPNIQRRVQIVFKESFKEMGYSFPDHWPKPGPIDYLLFYRDHIRIHSRLGKTTLFSASGY